MDTPNTMNYMIAGYAVIFTAMAAYLISLVVRFRHLRADERMLEEIEQDQPDQP